MLTENNLMQDTNEQTQEQSDIFEQIIDELFPDESLISVLLENIMKHCDSHTVQIQQIKELFQSEHTSLKIVADCQKQTAAIVNNEIERHALNPAIITVFTLTNLFQEINKQATGLKLSCCPLLNSITETAKFAESKCEHLGIEKIMPEEFEDFDSQKHEIKQAITTNESNQHKKIKQTLTPGLIYRNKILQPAKVVVYRYVEN